jgi:hypothetical protein
MERGDVFYCFAMAILVKILLLYVHTNVIDIYVTLITDFVILEFLLLIMRLNPARFSSGCIQLK